LQAVAGLTTTATPAPLMRLLGALLLLAAGFMAWRPHSLRRVQPVRP
jgi:hypothetical protein